MEEKDENAEFDIKDIYTPLSVAKKEIWRRWNDKELRKKVEDFLGGDVPEVFRNGPKATLFRFIATPNLEFQLAYDSAKLMNLDLVFSEFLNDKFCTRNQDKLCMGKMTFYHEKNGESQSVVSRKKIIDIEKNDNNYLNKMKTLWGESFVDFHHRIFNKRYKDIETFDVSSLKTNGESAFEVYMKFFPIFISNGILFENYFINSNKDERRFTKDVIVPAFNEMVKIFGIKPLIVPLVGQEEEGDSFWQFYSDSLINEIKY